MISALVLEMLWVKGTAICGGGCGGGGGGSSSSSSSSSSICVTAVHVRTFFLALGRTLWQPPSKCFSLCGQTGRKYKLVIIHCNDRFQYIAVTSIKKYYGNDTLNYGCYSIHSADCRE